MIQSRRCFGRGVRHAIVTGTITSIAMINLIAAKLTGGTSLTAILMKSQTVLQMRQVRM